MEHRKEELEKKRAKLAELRRQREERKRAALQSRENPAAGSSTRIDSEDINDLVNSLVGDRARSPTSQISTAAGTPGMSREGSGMGRDRSISAATSIGTHMGSPVPRAATPLSAAGPLVAPSPGTTAPGTSVSFVPGQRVVPEFKTSEIVIFDFPPKEKVTYNKEAQTTESGEGPDESLLTEEEIERRVKEIREKDEKARITKEEERARREAEAKAKENEIKRLTDEQRASILESGEFSVFIEQTSRVMERALDEDYDFMVDYTLDTANENDDASGEKLKLAMSFHDDKVSRNRSVMDLAWSSKFPELVAAAYNRNPMAPNEPDGIVALWNTHLKERPEFVFYAPSDVLRVSFSDFNPSLIVGGAYSGQILLWDTRAKAQPVLKTPLTAGGHTHPVYSLKVVGSTNAHQLISASTDGLVCSWQLDMLAQPQEAIELSHPAHLRTDEVSVTCFDFADNETTAFIAGTAEGVAYQVNRYDRAGSKAGLSGFDAYRAHTARINSINFHPPIASEFTDLFLTTSADWTTRLWRARPAAKPASTVPTDIKPLHVFDAFDDYVYDARWSPAHPAVFASVDGTGRLALWNLNHDIELPVQAASSSSGRALNRLAWDRPGRRIATGGTDGTVYIYDVGDLSAPRPDDHAKFSHVIGDLMN
ncbi:WD40 repeat-like protein [Martensiomyces pterosporus]|nr:WD40 repeat-like protein [Martensiomyces pterosporus]